MEFTHHDFLHLALFIVFSLLTLFLNAKSKGKNAENPNALLVQYQVELKNKALVYRNVSAVFALLFLSVLIGTYFSREYGLEAHFSEWMNLLVRWTHVIFGIAWIGASFYFIFLENSLNRTDGLRDELVGNLWAVHGGGFYYVEKYKVAPQTLPKTLHWFKYEAYFTWITGIVLMLIIYYMNPNAYMVDKNVADIAPSTAIWIGIGSLLSGWIIYDILCKSSLIHKKKAFAIVGFAIVIALSFILSKLLSGRAAFMHVGALLGTIMVANVFFVIIPSQKAMVRAAIEGKPLNPELGKMAGLRSLHNNYITFPVLYIMISNHFPSTFSPSTNWIILTLLIIASVAIKHYVNLHEKGQKAASMIPIAAVTFVALFIITAPKQQKADPSVEKITDDIAMNIIHTRCGTCHSTSPTDDVFKIAPNGVTYDSVDDVMKHKDKIMTRAVHTTSMPFGNKTNMTDVERKQLGAWLLKNH